MADRCRKIMVDGQDGPDRGGGEPLPIWRKRVPRKSRLETKSGASIIKCWWLPRNPLVC